MMNYNVFQSSSTLNLELNDDRTYENIKHLILNHISYNHITYASNL